MSEIDGTVLPGFENVAYEFERNFAERGECGASVCVNVGGQTVVDLWGGRRDRETDEPWRKDTLCPVYSTTKGVVALCAHLLIDRHKLDSRAPVADYWPEFGQNEKKGITVQMCLDHQAGVPVIRPPIDAGGFCDWQYMTDLIAREAPFWEPGTRTGYHAYSIGWIVGELVRRIENISLGEFIHRELVLPTDAPFYLGLQDRDPFDIAPIYPFTPDPDATPTEFEKTVMTDPASISALALLNNGGWDTNDPVCQRAEVPSGGALSNARGLSRVFAPFAQEYSAPVSRNQIHKMEQVTSSTSRDATLLAKTRYASGFVKSFDNRGLANNEGLSCILGHRAFGHIGAGGSIAFADPECGLSFGYAMNQMGRGFGLNDRGQSLIDATYTALGYRSTASGSWRR